MCHDNLSVKFNVFLLISFFLSFVAFMSRVESTCSGCYKPGSLSLFFLYVSNQLLSFVNVG